MNENEIGQLIKSLNDTAAGFDDINSMYLKIPSKFLVKPLPTFAICLFLKVFFQNSWRLEMLFLYIKSSDSMLLNNYRLVSMLCVCQRSLKRLCIIGSQLSLKYFKFYMVINMDLGRCHQIMCRVLSRGGFGGLNPHQNHLDPHFIWPWVQWTLCIDLSQAGPNFSYGILKSLVCWWPHSSFVLYNVIRKYNICSKI